MGHKDSEMHLIKSCPTASWTTEWREKRGDFPEQDRLRRTGTWCWGAWRWVWAGTYKRWWEKILIRRKEDLISELLTPAHSTALLWPSLRQQWRRAMTLFHLRCEEQHSPVGSMQVYHNGSFVHTLAGGSSTLFKTKWWLRRANCNGCLQ